MTKKRTGWRKLLLGLCIFVGVGALFGGGLNVFFPDGSIMQAQALIPQLQEIPVVGAYIDSLLLPAASLLLFIFVPQTIASVMLLRRQKAQYAAGLLSGIILSVFTVVELIFLPNPLSVLYLVFGVGEIVAAIFCKSDK